METRVDLQFFGDLYLPARVIRATGTSPDAPAVFAGVSALLANADHNVVNFEGTATTAFVPYELKRYLLRMPLSVPSILKSAGINVVTIANNHSMDFGFQGLFDTLRSLESAGIAFTGAGYNTELATRPVIVSSGQRTYCIFAFSKTLPLSFWATPRRPGTAAAMSDDIGAPIAACAAQGFRPIATFHWGKEGAARSYAYQRALARKAIDHGAVMVIGHHPHVLQEVETYKGRPIFYSLGNFAFGTDPVPSTASGLAVAMSMSDDGRKISLILTPLRVQNDVVRFQPRPLDAEELDPLSMLLPTPNPCRFEKEKRHWTCLFENRES